MSLPRFATIGICLSALIVPGWCGCAHTAELTAARPLDSDAAAAESAPAGDSDSSEAVEESPEPDNSLRDLLERAAWQKNREWSPDPGKLERWNFGEGPCRPLRWTFSGIERLTELESANDSDADPAAAKETARRLIQSLRAMAGVDSPHARNAAIALVHWNPREGAAAVSALERIACRPPEGKLAARNAVVADDLPRNSKVDRRWQEKVPLAMRSAAAEAWCLALASQSGSPEKNLAPVGRALKDRSLPVEVRAELIRALSVWIAPSLIPGGNDAFEQATDDEENVAREPIELRRAVADACLIHAWRNRRTLINDVRSQPSNSRQETAAGNASPETAVPKWTRETWPDSIHRARLDSDPAVRRSYGRWLAVANSPEALVRLRSQMSDVEPRVREDALVSLGLLGTDAAKSEILKHVKAPEDRVREFAARGLCQCGPRDVGPLLQDAASNVRFAIAEELENSPTVEAATLLKTLIADPDSQVQIQVARSIRRWPDAVAVPLLLNGMKSGARKTRDLCWGDLRKRTAAPDDFPVDASESERTAFLDQFIADHRLPKALPSLTAISTPVVRNRPAIAVGDVESVLERLQNSPPESEDFAAATEVAERWTERDLPVIEECLARRPVDSISWVERDLLPRLNPAYLALKDLASSDVFARRRAAQSLQRLSAEASLPRLLLARLWERMSREQDQLVWRSIMSAVIEDDLPEAARLAELAVNHTWPDIRVLGCDYARRHGNPRYTPWLLPLLSDPNKAVQLAAVKAAGACKSPLALDGLPARGENPAFPGLRSLLTSNDARLRFAAAATMSEIGDEQGMTELVRLGLHSSPETREQAAAAMGRSGQTRFVETLVQQSWTESNLMVRKAQLKSLEQLVPPENRPPQLGGQTSEDGKIKLWTAWWQKRQATASRIPPGENNP